jgi:hypothetical protein
VRDGEGFLLVGQQVLPEVVQTGEFLTKVVYALFLTGQVVWERLLTLVQPVERTRGGFSLTLRTTWLGRLLLNVVGVVEFVRVGLQQVFALLI